MKKVTTNPKRIRPDVAARLRYYVYAYVDPDTNDIFYVGKGCRGRVLSHIDQIGKTAKNQHLAKLKRANKHPKIDILAHGITDEKTALRIEAAVIDVLWPKKTLTNIIKGQTLEFGRVSLGELEAIYAAKPVKIAEAVLLIRINKLYRPGMSATALYECTRGVWRCGPRREKAQFGFAVFQGVIREVYKIDGWYKAGTLKYKTRSNRDLKKSKCWEFSGKISKKLSAKYTGRSVNKYFSQGAQMPFTYVNC